jgi:hypothetical protein
MLRYTALVASIGLVGMFALACRDSESQGTPAAVPDRVESPAGITDLTAQPSPEPTPEESQQGDQPFSIGERVAVEDFPDIIVEGFERSPSSPVGEDEIRSQIEPGEEFLIVTIRVINDTDQPAGINDFIELGLLSRGVDITDALSYGFESDLDALTLPVGAERVGRVVWIGSQGFDDLALEYRPGFAALFEQGDFANAAEITRYTVELD